MRIFRNAVFATSLWVFVVWVLITVFVDRLWEPSSPASLGEVVARGIDWSIVAALAFLGLAVAITGPQGLGLRMPRTWQLLPLVWVPALFLVAQLGVALAGGVPRRAAVVATLANTAMVGASEEIACRGFLLRGLRARLPIWPTIALGAALFGAIHVLNVFTTGDRAAAVVQAIAAALSGVYFIALRLRTGSLFPGAVMHALWDFAALLALLTLQTRTSAATAVTTDPPTFAALLFALPQCLFGLYLLRHAGTDEREVHDGSGLTTVALRR